MKKYFNFSSKFKPFYIILSLIFLLSVLCKVVLSYLSANHVYIYFNRIMNDVIQQYLLYILIIALSTFFIITIKVKALKFIPAIACAFFIFAIYIFNIGLGEADKKYFEFKSPNNKAILVEECSLLQGGWSNVYQKINSNIICGLDGNISTDDGYAPFSSNDYNLEWSADSVNITYGYGSENIHKSEVFKLK